MPESISPPFGELLRTFRFRTGLSQEALSEASGVSVRTISDLERGQRSSAHLETIRLLANALDVTTDEHRRMIESSRSVDIQAVASPHASIGISPSVPPIPAPATPLVGRASELDALMAVLTPQTGGSSP